MLIVQAPETFEIKPVLPAFYSNGSGNGIKIILDKEKNLFQFSGISIPEKASEVYLPAIQWLEKYKSMPNAKTEVEFRMDYICRESSVWFSKILDIFQEIHNKGNLVIIRWYYHIDDMDMRIEGRHFSNIYSLPFELINFIV